jgi:anti-anti-sigma factor
MPRTLWNTSGGAGKNLAGPEGDRSGQIGVSGMAIRMRDGLSAASIGGAEVASDRVLHVELERARSTALLLAHGELDETTAPQLVEAADRALDEPCDRLIISCEGLTFVDSTGLRALLAVRAACAGSDTRVYLVKRSPLVEHLLELGGMTQLFR